MSATPDLANVNAMLAEQMPDLARDLLGEPTSRTRDEWRYGGKGSLSVMVSGPKRGSWHDHEAGCGGDPLGLVAHLGRIPMREALRWALARFGGREAHDQQPAPKRAVAQSEAVPGASPPATLDLARAIWRDAVPPQGTLVASYLHARGLDLEHGAPIRFHPQAWRNARFGPRGPAMVALMSDPATGEPCGVHVTYLRPDGRGKAEGERAKIMLGNAGCIRLVPNEDVTTGLGIAEGIETSLAVMQGFGWRPVWAATSAGAIRRFPTLLGIEALTIFADQDGAGIQAARACAARWAAAGREARICRPPAGDFNDMIRERAA